MILTDHRSLKELMSQNVQTPEQHMYLTKLMGYDFPIQYRSSLLNRIADALSRVPEVDKGMVFWLSVPDFTIMDDLKRELAANQEFLNLRKELQEKPSQHLDFVYSYGLILQSGQIWLPNDLNFIPLLLHEFHSIPTGGHMGITKTLAQIQANFTWRSICEDVFHFVGRCPDCQATKYETQKSAGLLAPLSLPHRPLEDLPLDFIVGLPPYRGHTMILVVVDHFSKGIHSGLLPAQFSAYQVASVFLDIVAKHHGMPKSLVSDRDPLFICKFWQELFKISGTKLRFSSAYHPQFDGQTEVMNRIINQYLRAFVHNKPATWGKFLPWVEWSYNTSRNTSTGNSPFEVTFGKEPLTVLQYIQGSLLVDAVDTLLTSRETLFASLRKKLLKAQECMKHFADKHRREVCFEVGDSVMVKL